MRGFHQGTRAHSPSPRCRIYDCNLSFMYTAIFPLQCGADHICSHYGAGIEDFRIHDLRHTCAAWLVSVGVPLTEVRDLLGHSTIQMTERYAHLAPENVRAAVALLEVKKDGIESPMGGLSHDRVTLD